MSSRDEARKSGTVEADVMDAEGRRTLAIWLTVVFVLGFVGLGGWGVVHRIMKMVHVTSSTSK